MVLSNPNSDQLKGFVTIHGYNIVKAELNIKKLNAPIRIAPQHSLVLFQLLTLQNYFHAILDLISDKPLDNVIFVKQILRMLVSCQNVIESLPEREAFPNKTLNPQLFSPSELLEDVLIEFSIEHDAFVTTLIILGNVNQPGNPFKSLRKRKLNQFNGKDIIEEIVVKQKSPTLEALNRFIQLGMSLLRRALFFINNQQLNV